MRPRYVRLLWERVWQQYATDVRGTALPTGHFLPEEAPDLVTAAPRGFLDERICRVRRTSRRIDAVPRNVPGPGQTVRGHRHERLAQQRSAAAARRIGRGRNPVGRIVFICGALSIFAVLISRARHPEKKLDRQFWKYLTVFVVTAFILVGFPLVVILMASNGSIDILHLRYVAGWADRVAVACDIVIPLSLVGFPWWFAGSLSWTDASERTRQALPTWLAAFAAVATAVFIFALHFFRGGQLAKFNPALVAAACIGTVALVLPFYAPLARASWQRKLNPAQWWTDQSAARTEVWSAIPPVRWWTRRAAKAGRRPQVQAAAGAAPTGTSSPGMSA